MSKRHPHGCNDAKGESQVPQVHCLDRVWMLVNDRRELIYHAPATNAEDAWINGINFYNQRHDLKSDKIRTLFDITRDHLIEKGYRARRVVIGEAI